MRVSTHQQGKSCSVTVVASGLGQRHLLTALGLGLHREQRAADTVRREMIHAIEGGGMRGYFVPLSGRGLGARDVAWTAALCLRELREHASALPLAA